MQQPSNGPELEFTALSSIVESLKPLKDEQRVRILRYLADREGYSMEEA